MHQHTKRHGLLTLGILILILATMVMANAQNTILWRVTDSVSQNTSFILGTFHQMGNSFADSLPVISSSLYQSDVAIFESIDPVEKTRKQIMNRPSSPAIEKALGPKYFSQLQNISRSWEVDLHKLKPVELRWKLQQEYQKIKCKTVKPGDKWDHFDSYLIALAKEHDLTVLGLETDSMQLALINEEFEFPDWKSERKVIRRWIDYFNDPTPDPKLCQLAEAYRAFDLDYAFERPCSDNVLVKKRNQDWMQILPDFIRTNNCFIAVGYAHLQRDCGLLEEFRRMGFTVEPVDMAR